MTTPNSLLFLGNLTSAGSTAPVLPGNISSLKKPVNFYIFQKETVAPLASPIIKLQWSLDLNTFFPFRKEDGSIIEFTKIDSFGGILLIPRLNPDVFVRVNAAGDLGIQPDIDFFIG